jgi:hypothetical protein
MDSKRDCLTSLRQPRQPSWSWVSTDDTVQFFHWPGPENYHNVVRTESSQDVTIISARIVQSQLHCREDIQSGFIELDGLLVAAKCFRLPLDPTLWASQSFVCRYQDGMLLRLPCLFDTDFGRNGLPCYYLRISTWTMKHHMVPDHACMTYYLILEGSTTFQEKEGFFYCEEFRRIGIGYAPVHEVDSFFRAARKQVLTMI